MVNSIYIISLIFIDTQSNTKRERQTKSVNVFVGILLHHNPTENKKIFIYSFIPNEYKNSIDAYPE